MTQKILITFIFVINIFVISLFSDLKSMQSHSINQDKIAIRVDTRELKNISLNEIPKLINCVTSLRVLVFSFCFNSLPEKIFEQVLSNCTENLECLDISYCFNISNKSFSKTLEKFKKIRVLNFSFCNKLNNEILIPMIINSPLLEIFSIEENNNITDHLIEVISEKCPNLRFLDITGCNNITLSCLQHFLDIHKNCKIIYPNPQDTPGDKIYMPVSSLNIYNLGADVYK